MIKKLRHYKITLFLIYLKYDICVESAARPEWSSFFVAGKARQKIAGTEDGLSCHNLIILRSIDFHLAFRPKQSEQRFLFH